MSDPNAQAEAPANVVRGPERQRGYGSFAPQEGENGLANGAVTARDDDKFPLFHQRGAH